MTSWRELGEALKESVRREGPRDDVDPATKQRRLAEVIEVFRENEQQRNVKSEKGKLRFVLVEFDSRKA